MQRISLKLPDELLMQLNREAKSRRVSKSSLIRDALEQAFQVKARSTSPTCYDLARDLVGAVKGLPKDLTDNPKHLEGFGR
jgi:Ribbon-helix-helix protein, copG family